MLTAAQAAATTIGWADGAQQASDLLSQLPQSQEESSGSTIPAASASRQPAAPSKTSPGPGATPPTKSPR